VALDSKFDRKQYFCQILLRWDIWFHKCANCNCVGYSRGIRWMMQGFGIRRVRMEKDAGMLISKEKMEMLLPVFSLIFLVFLFSLNFKCLVKYISQLCIWMPFVVFNKKILTFEFNSWASVTYVYFSHVHIHFNFNHCFLCLQILFAARLCKSKV